MPCELRLWNAARSPDTNASRCYRLSNEIKQFALRSITLVNARAKHLLRELQGICDQKRDILHNRKQDHLLVSTAFMRCCGSGNGGGNCFALRLRER